MDSNQATDILKSSGYHHIDSLQAIPEGASHHVFKVEIEGKTYFAKFEKQRFTNETNRLDFKYAGPVSFERQSYLCDLVRNRTGLPTPRVEKIYHSQEGSFILLEGLPGTLWRSFIEERGYSRQAFLDSMYYLGADIAQAQRIRFPSFGDIIGADRINPTGLTNFAERLRAITTLRFKREEHSQALTEQQRERVKKFLSGQITDLEEQLRIQENPAVLVLEDFHPMQYLVDPTGKPTGYFDLEFCQAAPPALEFHTIALQLFNYFDFETYLDARTRFFAGFTENDGSYDQFSPANQKLETLLCAGQMLVALTVYHGAQDGLRNSWSQRFKDLLFQVIETSQVDYTAFGDIARMKTKQPHQPALP